MPTNHAVNGAEEHRALGGRGALPQVLQHQRAVAEDIYKLPEVKDSNLLQVLPLLVCGGRTDQRKDGRREIQRGEIRNKWEVEGSKQEQIERGAIISKREKDVRGKGRYFGGQE